MAQGSAEAHFILEAPASATEQNDLGDPQKAPPCGDDGTAVYTGEVTTYQPGETITITIDERVYHPGHYRVALALDDPSQLPDPPEGTPGATPCGSAPIDPAPTFPVLADGMLVHTSPFDGAQSFDITLPDDVTCEGCTLQVIQFMSDHALNVPGGCYYHHCATIAIEGDPAGATSASDDGSETSGDTPTTDGPADDTSNADAADDASAETSPTDGADSDAAPATETDPGADASGSDAGCSCSTPRGRDDRGVMSWGLLGLVALGLRVRARRR